MWLGYGTQHVPHGRLDAVVDAAFAQLQNNRLNVSGRYDARRLVEVLVAGLRKPRESGR